MQVAAPKAQPQALPKDTSSSLTAQQARKAGRGFVADHFGRIDTSGKGDVTLAEISQLMARRSPQKLMRGAPQ